MANRLASEQSPYLLQHQDNPVDWYPWGEEAFARARAEGKPVFLSIGYATCHWCHVMAHESFEDARLAAQLNRDFVSIKVDREERPDVDDIYMTAVQALTGSGGWPLSVFLTPERKPFYGGTYFPPADRYGRPGFSTVLSAIAQSWKGRPDEVAQSAAEISEHLEKTMQGFPGGRADGPVILARARASLSEEFDAAHGGFGGAPKFPPAMRLELLFRFDRRQTPGEPSARAIAETTLERMADGGLFDHVGGGFHRYSVDERWAVPHFEKMLYDNAMLARVYLLAARAFGREDFRRTAERTLDYLLREMTPKGGGFFAAQDADSGGHEGTFYVWNPDSVREAVGEALAPIVCARFGVTRAGNFEGGETVLAVAKSLPELSEEFGRPEAEVAAVLEEARAAMEEVRRRRVPPATDDKLLTDWTALAISAFALGARLCRRPVYERAARDAAERVLQHCRRGDELLHRQRGGRAGIPGFSTDYAFLVEALLDLYEATFEPRYFRDAVVLQDALEARFRDAQGGGYFLSSEAHDGLILRPREPYDGATPSTASIAASNLLRLASFTGDRRRRDRAEEVFSSSAGMLARAPLALARMLCALDAAGGADTEVVLAGERGRADFDALRDAVFESPALDRVMAHADEAESLGDLVPLVASRGGTAAKAYVCRNAACGLPLTDPGALAAALDV